MSSMAPVNKGRCKQANLQHAQYYCDTHVLTQTLNQQYVNSESPDNRAIEQEMFCVTTPQKKSSSSDHRNTVRSFKLQHLN